MPKFRAAYWIAADSQSDVLLTTPEQSGLSDDDLMAAALAEAAATGLEIGEGEIVIGDYRT